MAMLDKGMAELEDMLKDIEEVSAIIEFNSAPPGTTAGAEKGMFRAADQGAAVLAKQVGDDLRKWHETNEKHVVQYSADRQEQFERAVKAQQEEQESRDGVRAVVRRKLYELASKTIRASTDAVAKEMGNSSEPKIEDVAGAGVEALDRLKSRLEAVIAPVLALHGELPEDMQIATAAAVHAVEAKRTRAFGRRGRLPEVEAHLDSELLDSAERCMAFRKAELSDQYERQMELLSFLESEQAERGESAEAFEALVAAGFRQTAGNEDPWATLWPNTGVPRVAPRREETPIPQLSSAMEDAIADTLYPQLVKQGEVRVRNLHTEFHLSYLARDSADRAKLVGGELERWQLRAKLDLLKELARLSEAHHNDIMNQLRTTLQFKDDDPADHLERTLIAAEEFHKQREDFFETQVDSARVAVEAYCGNAVDHLASLRRRVELASLKRWHDISTGVDQSLSSAWVSCQRQLGEAALQPVVECMQALPLPTSDLDLSRGSEQVELLTVAWKRCGLQAAQQLAFVERLTTALPDTVESCAVSKAALVLLEGEIQRICELLKAPRSAH